ncbi:hypothetical protein BpHYR1_022064 [Brachionus plicatilis]|uniref:Uncharacterized protein n=1 Tax=Brachionus plicatilis TaxID=10195 RepID=A0A3M7PIX3_BRAPC|nr:hypothetical protein BpHYR1_022064 [Brachionus plicatilis]
MYFKNDRDLKLNHHRNNRTDASICATIMIMKKNLVVSSDIKPGSVRSTRSQNQLYRQLVKNCSPRDHFFTNPIIPLRI